MIIRGGENIYPRKIEQVLFVHPTVADVAMVGCRTRNGESRSPPSCAPRPARLRPRGAVRLLPRASRAAQGAPLPDGVEEFPQTLGQFQKFGLRERLPT